MAKMIKGIPHYVQETPWYCGVAAVQMVLSYVFAKDDCESQAQLAESLGTTKKHGTKITRIRDLLRGYGLNVSLEENMHIEGLMACLDAGWIVIPTFQAWRMPRGESYANEWECGHYAILIGYNTRSLFFLDPSLSNTIGIIETKEFMQRWHDYEVVNRKRKKYYRTALIVQLEKRPTKKKYTRIE